MNRKNLLNLISISAAALSLMLANTAFSAGQQTQQRGMEEGQGSTQQSKSFSELDQNQDGSISEEEAENWHTLGSKFDEADRNSDQTIDRSEFSAFERMEGEKSMHPQEGGMGGESMRQQEKDTARERGNYPD
ncbi:EF-hand domain-containing protein [Nitrosococcus wardiae]|uniref:EF-hand domain-containing protein n=1 Tax=Nitrosococcus wardiae TaxID=1814290 RepID=A0A4P7BZM5_9GAMM|nr:EF-hand domain-containing protein [Nitrosococcus wardiae]QBQ55688.1 EF-hand domain-containing protein [Nitrosococcus wardiae]